MVLKTKWSQTWNSAEMERAHPQHSTEQVAPDGVCEFLLLMVLMASSPGCGTPGKDTGLPGNQQSTLSPASLGGLRRRMVSLF